MALPHVSNGHQSDTSTSNMLINMYSKCRFVDCAREVFDEMRVRSEVSWNTMIGAYTQNGGGVVALKLFVRMLRDGSEFSPFALSSLCACTSNALQIESKQLHAFVVKTSMESNLFAGTALLDVYANCRSVEDASMVFETMPEKSEVTGSSMMAGFVQNSLYEEARERETCRCLKQNKIPTAVKEGDTVLLPEYAGTQVILGEKEIYSVGKLRPFLPKKFPYIPELDKLLEDAPSPFIMQHTARISGATSVEIVLKEYGLEFF